MTIPAPAIGIDGHDWRSAKSLSSNSTTSRATTAEETWERIHPLLADYGITRIANVTGLDITGIPVFNAIKPLGRSLSTASGKGTTVAESRVGAAMEGIEQTVWESQPLGEIYVSEYELNLSDMPFIPSRSIPRRTANLSSMQRQQHWTAGWDIVNQREVLVPSLAVCIPNSYRDVWGGPVISSNGLASGNTVLEAVSSALLEVIERDAVSGNVKSHSQIDLSSITDPLARELLERLSSADLTTSIVDVTAKTDIPTYAATVFDQAHESVGSWVGYGSSLDSHVALVRAITEAAQVRNVVISGARDDIFDLDLRAMALVSSRGRLVHNSSKPELSVFESVRESSATFEEDIQTIIGKLANVGIHQVIVIRHSLPQDVVQVVRVIVPELWANLHGGTETFPIISKTGGNNE